jgi:hypothetical protein
MTGGSLSVPVRAHQASLLADLVFQFTAQRPLDDALRRLLAARAAQAPLEGLQVYWDSLAADPSANSTFYLAVDAPAPLLLHVALASAPASAIFPAAALVGRMRTPRGLEVVMNAVPFSEEELSSILAFAQVLDRAVLPRPQGVETLYIAARSCPDTAFREFRSVQRKFGLSVAAWSGPPAAGLWGAIRHGWRDGLAMPGESEVCSRMVLHGDSPDLEDRMDAARGLRGRNLDLDLNWAVDGLPTVPSALHRRLGRLKTRGHQVKVAFVNLGLRADGSYPASVDEVTGWPEEIVSAMEWRAGGNLLEELRQRVEALQETAKRFGSLVGLVAPAMIQDAVLDAIAAGAARRIWFDLGDRIPSAEIANIAARLRG